MELLFLLTVLVIFVASILDVYSTASVFRTNSMIRGNRELGIRLLEHRLKETDPLEFEKNAVVRWFLMRFGVHKGLLIHRIVFLPFFLIVSYFVYVYGGRVFILVFGGSCVYLGMMIRQYLDEHWRREDFKKMQGN